MQDIIISQPWGGLGDNLQFSTLPELFAAKGHKVFVSADNAFRNAEIADLVWSRNPFIKGYSDAPANAGAVVSFDNIPKSLGYIERIEMAHGLEPRNRFPKIYYKPQIRPEFEGAIVIDINSITVGYGNDVLSRYVESVFCDYGYDRGKAIQIRFAKSLACGFDPKNLQAFTGHTVSSIYEYCDILGSCHAFVTTHSGAHALAVALRQFGRLPLVHCYCNNDQYNSRQFIFEGVHYHLDDPLANKRLAIKARKEKVKELFPRLFPPKLIAGLLPMAETFWI
jgi:hypothetical protein